MKYILSIDQGTSSTRAILFNKTGEVVAVSQQEITQYYPAFGYVEHDPLQIYESVLQVVNSLFVDGKVKPEDIAGIGITNQRETTVVWDKRTGLPIHNAVVWQSLQSQDICDGLINQGYQKMIKDKTGLIINPYFSGTKIKWLLDNVSGARDNIENLLFGTIDTWLIWKLTGGVVHATDYSNVSRTMLYNIYELDYDQEILNLLDIPKTMLPEVKDSSGIFGYTDATLINGIHFRTPICGVAGDQQASLFGQTCFDKGDAKNTYGTGCFMLMNTKEPVISNNGLLTTIAWGINGEVEYALEGSVFIGGAAIQWLRDGLKIIEKAGDSQAIALSVEDSNGVYVVPAFVGLGTPYWDDEVKGSMFGLTRATTSAHIVRATLEAIAYQCKDVFEVMKQEARIPMSVLSVDGGATANDFLMQFQSDILNVKITKPRVQETTALGAAYLAGLAVGIYQNKNEIKKNHFIEQSYNANMAEDYRNKIYEGWGKAIGATRAFK